LEDSKVNLVLFGPPGAGKGTQADFIVKAFNLHKISTGDLLRNEIEKNTVIGDEIKSLIEKGSFVSDNIINNLLNKTLSNKKLFNRLVFDGYPRNLQQAKNLDKIANDHNQKISCVLSLNVDKDLVIKRILGRQSCSNCGLIFNEFFYPSTKKNHTCGSKFLTKRSDDNEKTIINRFETYLTYTLPILDFYKEKKLLHQINGMREKDEIFKEIRGIIASLET